MERIIQAKVLRIEKPQGKTPERARRDNCGLAMSLGRNHRQNSKITVRKAIFKEQDTMIVTNERIEVRGTGKTTVKQGA
jgi:hypothetical protein